MRVSAGRIEASFGFAMLILIVFGFAAWRTASHSLESFHQFARSDQLGNYLESTLVEVLNMETGGRGYVISGQEKFLEPYLHGRRSVTSSLTAAKALATPEQQQHFATLEQLIQRKLDYMEKTIELRRSGDITSATQQIASGQGKELTDQIRKVIGDLEAEENVLLQKRLVALETEASQTINIVSVALVVACVLVGLAGLQAQREFRRRSSAEAELRLVTERLALAAQAGNVGIWDWNVVTGEVFWDDAMFGLLGTTRDKVAPAYQAFLNLLHPDERQRVADEVQMALNGEKSYAAEFRVVWPDGSIHHLQANSTILHDRSGKAVRMLGTNWDVTQRKMEEQKFRSLLEAAPDAMVITTREGIISIINAQAQKLFGYSRDELTGKPVEILVPKRFRARHPALRKEFVASSRMGAMSPNRNLTALRKNGTEVPVEISLSPLDTAEGLFVIAAVRDVTQRVQIENALRDSAEQQRHLAERLENERARLAEAQAVGKVGSWELDLRNDVLTWSDENYRIFGMDPTSFGGSYEAFLELIPPEERAKVHKAYTESVTSHQPYEIDHKVRLRDGTMKVVQERCQTFYDEQGKPIRSVGTTQDITARQEAEESLREKEQTLRLLAESMPQIVWICRPDGWNVYFNQQWVDYTGLTMEQSLGHGWNIPFHPDDQLRAWNAWKIATESGGKYDLECRLRRADGVYRWFLIRGVPLRNERGEVLKWFGTCTDIDDMKKAEDEINSLNARLAEHSATLEKQVSERTSALRDSIKSLETLTYTIAHDLRAPLRAMAGYTEALLEDVPLNETGKRYAQQIHQSSERMSHLIKDLLDYGQLTHLEAPITAVNLETEVEKLIRHFELEIRQTKADVRVETRMPVVMANARLLDQVLSNLLSNAMKFVAPNVTPKICLRTELRGAVVRLWIEDNGIGIAPEHLAKIFGVFQRLHTTEKYPGTGVGLAIVKRAVEMMKGTLGVESEVNKGARFWIELPLAKDQRPKNRPELTSKAVGRVSDTEWLQKHTR